MATTSDFARLKQFDANAGMSTGVAASSGLNLGAYAPAISMALGAWSNVQNIKAQAQANIDTMRSAGESLKTSQAVRAEQLEQLNEVMRDRLSDSGLEAMKAEARLKAAAAETGGSGTSINDAIATADVNRLHRDALIMRQYDINRASKLNEIVSARLNFRNQTNSIISGQPSSTSAITSSLLSTLQSGMVGYNYLNQSQKENFFGINITG